MYSKANDFSPVFNEIKQTDLKTSCWFRSSIRRSVHHKVRMESSEWSETDYLNCNSAKRATSSDLSENYKRKVCLQSF